MLSCVHHLVVFIVVLIAIMFMMTEALTSAARPTNKKKVIVTGAGGQTGQALFRKLLASHDFEAFGLVRSQESKQALVVGGSDGRDGGGGGVAEDHVLVADVTNPQAVQAVVEHVGGDNLAGFCICTSAKPKRSEEINPETGRPIFTFRIGRDPEQVDWIGQKSQIDACPEGCHVVLCSTMGGTNPNHPLNALGRTANTDGTTSGGMIVLWKRKSEVYLMMKQQEHSVLSYTIVHPGGLINEPGGERELVVGVNDSMEGTESRTIPREDVAQVMMEALRYPQQYAGRSFDLCAKSVGDGTPTTNFAALLDPLKGANCDYSLGTTM